MGDFMSLIHSATLFGVLFGMLGTILGGFIGCFLNFKSNKYLSFLLEFSAGLMTAIICFDLIPESILKSGLLVTILGILIGSFILYIINFIIDYKLKNISSLLKTSYIIFIGLSIHNFPEGLAIGAGFINDKTLGLSLALAIAIHDIPEGMSISSPLVSSGISKKKAFLISSISGITTGIGAFLGATISSINTKLIGFSLSLAAGTMLYIISHELISESKKLYNGSFPTLGFVIGTIIGIIIFI